MKKRKRQTTKNTVPKMPVTRLSEITIDINGVSTIVTNIADAEFEELYLEWFDHPSTFIWSVPSLAAYIKQKRPDKIVVIKELFDKIVEGKFIPATKEEYEAENN